MGPRRRLPAILVVCALLSALGGPAPARAARADDWRAQVRALLERRARAVLTGDRAAFDATMTAAPRAFREAKGRSFTRLRALPLGAYSLELRDDGYLDLAAAVRDPPAGNFHVVRAIEHVGFKGYDAQPGGEAVYLTVARSGTGWNIISDDDLDDLGLLSARDVWDFGPVRTLERGGVLVVHHGDAATADAVLRSTLGAMARVRRTWPYGWRARVVVMMPRTRAELGRILQATFDLAPFVAFTSSSVERRGGGYRLSGHRIYVEPRSFRASSVGFRDVVLGHEVLHLATRPVTGASVPVWLDEGVAQVYGEPAVRGLGELARRVRSGTFDGRLPDDWIFTVGTRREISLAYGASVSFVAYLRGRFGRAAGARLYRALGAESAVSFGTGRYHLGRAAGAAFGVSFASLLRAWTRRIEREFG